MAHDYVAACRQFGQTGFDVGDRETGVGGDFRIKALAAFLEILHDVLQLVLLERALCE